MAILPVMLGCGSDGYSGGIADGGRPAPPTVNCTDLCSRFSDCITLLCNEDTMSTRYAQLEAALGISCRSGCTDAVVRAQFSADSWRCFFQASCRDVFAADICHARATYTCN